MSSRRMLVVLFVLLASLGLVATAAADPNNNNSEKLRAAVTVAGIREHQAAFQAIADANGGNRFSGLPGYDASAQYVYDKAVAAGYNVRFQEFEYLAYFIQGPFTLEQVAPTPTLYVEDTDYTSVDQSEPGDVTAPVTAVDLQLGPGNASTSGCEAADFAGFPAGNIALIQRGTCTFEVKAENAAAAGASGVIIFNQGNTPDREPLFAGTLGATYDQNNVPVVATSYARGVEWAGTAGLVMHLVVDTIREIKTTRNVIAETQEGDPNNVVVVGAHLDSVAAGPGINDNGSGSATILEIAEQMEKVKPRNMVRFIWFAAEESGLVGSGFYVNSLSPAELDRIALMLNFDMLGSPNFVRFVYDGDNSAFPVGPGVQAGPPGSGEIEQVFTDYFTSQGLVTDPTPFNGRSDYGPFIAQGIPAGGLFSGAEEIKTAAQAATYGGTAGIQLDPCYHQACDTFANNSNTALDQMSDAVAHAVITFAQEKTKKNGKVKANKVEFKASK
jgi:Zn-dependent M28 family amino/carboxypeptidase